MFVVFCFMFVCSVLFMFVYSVCLIVVQVIMDYPQAWGRNQKGWTASVWNCSSSGTSACLIVVLFWAENISFRYVQVCFLRPFHALLAVLGFRYVQDFSARFVCFLRPFHALFCSRLSGGSIGNQRKSMEIRFPPNIPPRNLLLILQFRRKSRQYQGHWKM